MKQRNTYLQYLITAALCVLLLSGCSDDNEPTTNVPPQSTESQPVSVTLSLGALTRAVGVEVPEEGVKTQWEQGDKVYFHYTKTFADDWEIENIFTLAVIDIDNPASALFTCSEFIMPRGIKEGKLVYIGAEENLGSQFQRGNNNLDNIAKYLRMESVYFPLTIPEEMSQVALLMKHVHTLVTLEVKRPENWTGQLSDVVLTLNSNNVTLLGTTGNRIVLTLEDADWENDRLIVHFIVSMAGLVNEGNTWTVEVREAGSQNMFSVTRPAKQWDGGNHYTSLISDDPSDYDTPVYIEVPGFEDAGSAF